MQSRAKGVYSAFEKTSADLPTPAGNLKFSSATAETAIIGGFQRHVITLYLFHMKRLLAIVALALLAGATQAQKKPMFNYDAAWKKVDQTMKKELAPESAMKEVDRIMEAARKEGNEPQFLKALLYRGRLKTDNTEEWRILEMEELRREIKGAKGVRLAVLHGMLADSYWNYLQENRWQLYNRTRTDRRDSDPRTWNAEEIHSEIQNHFKAALKEAEALKKTPTADFEALLVKGNQAGLRPTLYDVMAHAALSYYSSDDHSITDHAASFRITDTMAFADARRFAAHRFPISDSASLHANALLVYQDLVRFHLKDSDPAALLDTDMERLRFVTDKSTLEDREARYREALAGIAQAYPSATGSAQAVFLRCESLMKDAEPLNGRAPAGQADALPRIRELCRKVMSRHPGTEGAANCAQLVRRIDERSLSLLLEKVNVPGEPFRCLVSFRNAASMHYRILPAFKDPESMENLRGKEYWDRLKSLKPILQKRQALPATADLRGHSVEIAVDPLPVGRYLLLASVDESFDTDKGPMSVLEFHVSGISWINRGSDYFILDRSTGRPLSGAQVVVYKKEYDYGSRKRKSERVEEGKSDADGFLRVKSGYMLHGHSYTLDVTHGKDNLFIDGSEYRIASQYNNRGMDPESYEKANRQLLLFTDRSIYRPGQTVYFKGLMVTKDHGSRRPKLVTGFRTRMELLNANGDRVDSLDVTTGAYGSFSGSFRIPEKGLTGTFFIGDVEKSQQSPIQVEEYKRPTFSVEWQKPANTLRLDDEVAVTGTAKAYSGNPLNNAKVRYRIRRTSRFPYPWLRFGFGMPAGRFMEVVSGETATNAEGVFTVRFPATPDRSIDPKTLPVFDFQLTAEVTDLNGETRAGEETLSIGYHAMDLSIGVRDEEVFTNAEDIKVPVTATSLAGVEQKVAVDLKLTPLSSPRRLIRQRYWEAPDTHIMTEKEYVALFPYDEYDRERDREHWKTGEPAWQAKDSLASREKGIRIPVKGRAPGWYRIEATTDDGFGRPVTTRKDIRIQDAQTGKPDPFSYFTGRLSEEVTEPGRTVTMRIGSDADDLWVIRHIDGHKASQTPATPTGKTGNPKKTVAWSDPGHEYRFVMLNRNTDELRLPVSEEDRGGFGVSHAFVKHNRLFTSNDIVRVPWSDKDLQVVLSSFRDKVEPGAKETWSIKIKGNKGEKVAAEALLSMYDASLDQFLPHGWQRPQLFETYPVRDDRYMLLPWTSASGFHRESADDNGYHAPATPSYWKEYPRFIWEDDMSLPLRYRRMADQDSRIAYKERLTAVAMAAPPGAEAMADSAPQSNLQEMVVVSGQARKKPDPKPVTARRDFRETAFFMPDLTTDPEGNISFAFTMPEALTEWKWQVLAHTKELAIGLAKQSVVTRKELMVQPNAPRFLREGDQLVLPARISNLTDREVSGEALLELFDTETGKPVDGVFNNMAPRQFFTAPAGQGTDVGFRISVPGTYSGAVTYRIVARTSTHSDGEEKAVPVLSNRMLVTEALPLKVKGLGTRRFDFEKLEKSAESPSLTHHRLTFEYSSNPAWYAVRSLPYLTTYPYECAEQLFNKFYANAVAGRIASSEPRIRANHDKWLKDSVRGNLSRNPELKDILLEETPWVFEGRDEERQARDIARLFDPVRLSAEQSSTLDLLAAKQSSNGGFVWFTGGPDDRYMTQYILTGMARLKQAKAMPSELAAKTDPMIRSALAYVRARLTEDHREAVRKTPKPAEAGIGDIQVQALYTLSAFGFEGDEKGYKEALAHYRALAAKGWTGMGLQSQAMTAIMLHRSGDAKTPATIMKSLKERAVKSEELGMYWKSAAPRWYWQNAPVETQSMLIEAFTLLTKDPASVSAMKQWLLTQKQTNRWSSTRSTADACHALLMNGADWLKSDRTAEIRAGVDNPMVFKGGSDAEAGTGYFKAVVDGPFVEPELGRIEVSVQGKGGAEDGSLSWGSAYWQYFETLDRIRPAETPLSVVKRVFIERNTPKGPVLQSIEEGGTYQVGDRLKVRIELRSDRDMEYVHLKDMRASGSEPLNVLSGYRWQGGLGYYESTRDAATNFFFGHLPKGTHVFEYTLYATHEGRFSVGPATVECMYAPEFRAHSAGIEIRVRR